MTKKEKREGDDRKSDDKAEARAEKMRKIKEEDDSDLNEILAELDKELSEEMDSEDDKKDIKEDEKTDAEEEGYKDGEEDADDDMDEDEDVDLEDMSEEDLKKFIEDVIEDMVGAGELEAGESFEDDVDVDVDEDGEVEVEDDMETAVDVELDEAKKKDDKDDNESGYDAELGDSLTRRKKADKSTIKQREADSENAEKGLGKRKYSGDKSMDKVKEELREAYATVGTLKTELNEINLLNAKLLYTNKIFKSKNLTEAQKVRVLESFDKATTVKEAKLVFSTVNSGLKSKKTRVNENLGRASKSAGMAVRKTSKQPIVESDEMVKRFQKLAGIL